MDSSFYVLAALVMMAISAGFLYALLRHRKPVRPEGPLEWMATVLSSLLFLTATALLVIALNPPEPAVSTAAVSNTPEVRPDELDRPAPDFAFRRVADESEARLSGLEGNVVVLNFWATWCAPCLQELPELNRLQEVYKDQGVVVLTVSDEHRLDLLAFSQEHQIETLSAYLDDPAQLPDPFKRTLAVRPTSYVIDRDGIIRDFMVGAGDFSTFEKAIQPYL